MELWCRLFLLLALRGCIAISDNDRGGSRKNIRGALAIESIIMYYKQMRHVIDFDCR